MEVVRMAELSVAPLKRIAKKAGVERVAGDFDLAAAVENALIAKFRAANAALKAAGKKTLTKEFVDAALA
jgi:histone H3/H4